ncbi:MAG TPA: DUF2177 family protein [Ramlibacter sp.]|uniref:DUF2177 family protein n=1 Tax=Ramlibacter sp. TaxID=1917967 RepID=UPI002D4DD364|nr:DUF2177 family protein [Ramlibacter sp.]HZY17425.1 DUF2177 family protein [Ramlibacter sp.]
MARVPLAYVAALVAIGVLDFIWLRLVATAWYEAGMGHLMAARPHLAAAAAFYFLYPVGVLVFAALPAAGDPVRALLLGALFGAFCYGTFDLTSLAVLRDYPAWLALLDIGWGAFVSACGAVAAALAWRALAA